MGKRVFGSRHIHALADPTNEAVIKRGFEAAQEFYEPVRKDVIMAMKSLLAGRSTSELSEAEAATMMALNSRYATLRVEELDYAYDVMVDLLEPG